LCPGPTRTEFGEVAGFGGSSLFERVAMESPEVVEAGLRGLDKNRAVVIPGLVNKVVVRGSWLMPRQWVRRITGLIKY
jgi:short-subunit dehydrogenase